MSQSAQHRRFARFESFQLDLRAGELRKKNRRIRLQNQPFQILVLLLENAGEVVTQEQIQQKLWPDHTVVEFEHSIGTALKKLRQKLGDDAASPRYIETLSRRGYRWLVPVEWEEMAAAATDMGRTSFKVSERVADSVPAPSVPQKASQVQLEGREQQLDIPTAAQSSQPGDQRPCDRVAVFPLANPDGSPDTEYLLSGIPGSIIRGLAPLPGLTVVAGGVVPGNERGGGNAQTFGRKFGVGTALLGRLLHRRTKIRLQVDLVDTKTGEELWADQYDRDFAEFFQVQDDVVKNVSNQLRLNLAEEDSRLSKRYTENAEAFQLYLRGLHWFESRTAEGFRKSIEYFKNAIQTDPRFALAHAELAAVLYLPGYYGMVHPQESFPEARSSAERALDLDGKLAEAHEVLATLDLFDWRWEDAEREYKHCLEINPNHTLSHYHYAMCLSELGRFTEAIAEAKEAQVRDPLSGSTNAGLAWTLWAAGEYEKALHQALIATEVDPHSMFARVAAGLAYEQNGMYRESIAEFQEGIQKNGGSMFLGFQSHAFARSGDRSSAWNNVRKLENLSKERYVAPSHLAIAYAGLEEKNLAIQSLQAAYENRDSFLVFTRMLPQFENLRSDSRFQDLLHRMNFPS